MRWVQVKLAATRGSTPREAGVSMLVGEDRVEGSIGGGQLEFRAIATARELLAQWSSHPPGAGAAHHERLALGPALGQCCGGAVELAYTPSELDGLAPPEPLFFLQLHGAGHVGRAIARLLRTLPCEVQWIDEREDMFASWQEAQQRDGQASPARIECIAVDAPQAEVALAPPGAFYLAMTHRHDLDFAIGTEVLRRGDHGWLGCIGSASKSARFVRRWAALGIDAPALERFVCPIGVDAIPHKSPECIAVAVCAQLLQWAGQRGA
jgi:xanthine dehydrogenase accessory factor